MHPRNYPMGAGLFLVLSVLPGCKDDKKPTTESPAASAESNKSNVDPEVALALAAVSANPTMAVQAKPGGPPEAGVFAAGAADKEMPKGAAPKITIGSDGAEPRVALGVMFPPPGPKSALRTRLSFASGGRSLLPMDFRLAFEPAGQPPKPGSSELVDYQVRVVNAGLDASQVAAVDEKLKVELGKLRGSKIRFKLAPSGVGSDFVAERARGSSADFEDTLRSLSEILAIIMLPYPDKPVGAGAYWMATTRETVVGFDTVAYRLVTVEKVEGDRLSLKVDSKRYAATNAAPNLAGLPPNAGEVKLEQFKSMGQGTLTVSKGSAVPSEGKLNQELVAVLSMSSQPGQPAVMQNQVGAIFSKP
jgi:hypothetical protein